MHTSLYSVTKHFIRFVSLFIGTGFIAGSIVHFGEGVTVWDTTVLIIGIVLFVSASFVEERRKKRAEFSTAEFGLFIVQSLFLAIGIGMASGGTQHFIDTPGYAAVLIPLGLWVGLLTFFWKEKLNLSLLKWCLVVIVSFVTATVLWWGLIQFNRVLPDSLRVGHGSHGHGQHSNHNGTTESHSPNEDDMSAGDHGTHHEHHHGHSMSDENGFIAADDIDVLSLPEVEETTVMNVQDGDRIELHPTLVRKTINGKTFAMYGYNKQIPGPIIKAEQGATITVDVANRIDMETTIHWHGLRHNNKYDGVPDVSQDFIQPEGTHTYTVHFPDEGVYWYHPHVREDIQQDLGLYGNLLVSSENNDAYAPVNQEEVIVLDDLLIEGDTIAPYGKDNASRPLMGRFGNTVLTNGKPILDLYARKGSVVRFYVTNVASTRTFNFRFSGSSNDPKMKRVASDIGRYEKEEWVDSIIIAPAERYVVDVLFDEEGTYDLEHISPLNQLNLAHVHVFDSDDPKAMHIANELSTESYKTQFMELRSNNDVASDIDAFRPYFDNPIDKELELSIELSDGMDHSHMHHDVSSDIEWEDTMAAMNEMMSSNEVQWQLIDTETGNVNHQIHWNFSKGDIVKIRIHNNAKSPHPMQHPIHFHGQRFLVLDIDGQRQENLVWKDTVLVPTGSTVDLLFDMSNPGEWMFHCHIAEHLTNGMMGMFSVHE